MAATTPGTPSSVRGGHCACTRCRPGSATRMSRASSARGSLSTRPPSSTSWRCLRRRGFRPPGCASPTGRTWCSHFTSKLMRLLKSRAGPRRTARRVAGSGPSTRRRLREPGSAPAICSSRGACAGAGIPPQRISRVMGVVKAYTTAVGAGPMPTELVDGLGARLRELGQEYGASTGRPRRCGWFDGVAARFAAEVSGFTDLAVMKLDVLDGFDTVKICVAYRDGPRLLTSVPHTAAMTRVEPVYEELPGWRETSDARTLDELPDAARAFLERVEQVAGVPVSMVGVGQEREALIMTGAGPRAPGLDPPGSVVEGVRR